MLCSLPREGGDLPFNPRKKIPHANSAPAQPAPHAHMAVPECSLCGQALAAAFVIV